MDHQPKVQPTEGTTREVVLIKCTATGGSLTKVAVAEGTSTKGAVTEIISTGGMTREKILIKV